MRRAKVYVHGAAAGVLEESAKGGPYRFVYESAYEGPPVSLTMPVSRREYVFAQFPPFFEGLLPEGVQLEALLKACKIDKGDLFRQLMAVGLDTVGAVTVEEMADA